MQAAAAAAARGHRVTLFESADRLGGALALIAGDPGRAAWRPLLDHLQRELDRTGVEIRLGVSVGPDDLAGADRVIVATGGREVGREGGLTSAAVLAGAAVPPGPVVVASGHDEGLDGPMTALLLAARGHRVTLATETFAVGEALELGVRHVVIRNLLEAGVRLAPLSRCTERRLTNVMTGRSRAHRATVVWAAGRHAERALLDELAAAGRPGIAAGDCLAPRRLVHAMLDGARAGASV
jgi:2,4-dienoyl-CoA reductase (NADPH2)